MVLEKDLSSPQVRIYESRKLMGDAAASRLAKEIDEVLKNKEEVNIEGPIDSNKTSFILGARTTYSNWLLKLLPDDYKQSKASFTDVNLGISHQFDEKNNIYFSGYYSTDDFK